MDKNKFILTLLIAVVGLLMIVSPATFIAMVVIILGIGSAVDGIFILVTMRNLILDPRYKLMMTIRGIMSVLVGLTAVICPLAVAYIAWTFMLYVLGVYLLVSAALEIYGITKLYRNGITVRQPVIEVAVSVVLAIILFILPSKTDSQWIVRVFGAILFVISLIMAFIQWRTRPITVYPESVEDDSSTSTDEEKTDITSETESIENEDN